MKTTIGCPTKQKKTQKDTLPNSLFVIIRILPNFFWMKITGACESIAKKAHHVTNFKGTDTAY